MSEDRPRVLVDGRVFSTEAYDRGMGRYVSHIVGLLNGERFDVTLLLYRNCFLGRNDALLQHNQVRFANYDPEYYTEDDAERQKLGQSFSGFLAHLVDQDKYDVYVDATPFIGPTRLDLLGCATIAICYDFIPLRHASFYLPNPTLLRTYYNGLARLGKADYVICISQTVKEEARKYLGISPDRLSVVCPRLETVYESCVSPSASGPVSSSVSRPNPYLFAIAGSHKSKNPEAALCIYRGIVDRQMMDVVVNAPKPDQLDRLSRIAPLDGIEALHSITDERKFNLQANAAIVGHLSLEEGFGIPLLEAVFLRRKVLVLDIPMNREILGKTTASDRGAVMWLRPDARKVSPQELEHFLATESNITFYSQIQKAYADHWSCSGALLNQAVTRAMDFSRQWLAAVRFKIFSSIPGTCCGVADYSVAYARSSPGNVAFFFKDGEQENISYLQNVRATGYREFPIFSREHPQVPGLYNLAFSEALNPGIGFLAECAREGDALLVHERFFLPALWHHKSEQGKSDDISLDLPRGTEKEASDYSLDLALSREVNSRPVAERSGGIVAAHWLARLPVKLVSHLPPSVLERMKEATKTGTTANDLSGLEERLEFAPLGIDPRSMPTTLRSARLLRTRRGIQQDDLVLGHFGLILDDLKRLWDAAQSVANFIATSTPATAGGRRVFFVLVGRVIDEGVFDRILTLFRDLGISGRLIYANPAAEDDFDAEIAACDAVFCFRRQTRGQLSHVLVRALSLGRPVIVNDGSGYGYDERTHVADENLSLDVERVLNLLMDDSSLRDMRRYAHAHYEKHHRGDASLERILGT